MGDGGSSASLIAAELRSSSSGCEQEPPGRFSLPQPAGSPCGGSALARLPPGQVSADRRAPPPRPGRTAGHRRSGWAPPGTAGPAGAAAAGERGRRGGRSLPNSSSRLVPAYGCFPFLLSAEHSRPVSRSPPRQSAPKVPAAARIFVLSCLCVCCLFLFVFPSFSFGFVVSLGMAGAVTPGEGTSVGKGRGSRS